MLSPKAEKIIDRYFNLPFDGASGIRCPYYNNSRRGQRGQLRALIGKGAPEEIVEEAKIISIQYHHGLFDKDGHCCIHGEHNEAQKTESIRKFLIDHDLGVDCSGFAAQVLLAHFKENNGVDIGRRFYFWPVNKFVRWIIAKLRPVENMSVRVFAKEKNSEKIFDGRDPIDAAKIEPGDIVIMLETGPNKKRNHIILFTDIAVGALQYVSARAWSSEGKYGHGVERGIIRITKPGGNLLEQTWEESGKSNEANETYLEAKNAAVLEIRRVKI
jgi:hypothetical protein